MLRIGGALKERGREGERETHVDDGQVSVGHSVAALLRPLEDGVWVTVVEIVEEDASKSSCFATMPGEQHTTQPHVC